MRKQLSRPGFLPMLAGLILSLLMHVTLAQAPQQGSGAAEPLVVATDTAFLPFEFKEDGRYVGFDIDLLDAIAKEMGIRYTLLPMDFANIFPSLADGRAAMAMAGITLTQERERSVDFSDPYFRSGLSLVVADGNTQIKKFDDLADKAVAVKRGTDGAVYVQRVAPQARLVYFQNTDAAFPYLEVAAGRLDALVQDTPNVLYYTRNKGKGFVRVVQSVDTENGFYAIALPKGSPLTPKVNAALRKVIGSGVYAGIYKKWFGVTPDIGGDAIR